MSGNTDIYGEQLSEYSAVSEECTCIKGEEISPSEVFPLVDPENAEIFKELASAFGEAEKTMKLVEWMEGTDVPSINELRYVSYHLFKACQFQDDKHKQKEELYRAKRHCNRAAFDAVELGIIGQLEKIKKFKNDFADYPVSDVLIDYIDLLTQTENAKKFISNVSGVEDRNEYYGNCEPHLENLERINTRLDIARSELSKKRKLFESAEKRARHAEKQSKFGILHFSVYTLFKGWVISY